MTLAVYIAGLLPSPDCIPVKPIMKVLGPVLIVLFYGLMTFVTSMYFKYILPYYSMFQYSGTFIGINTSLGLFLLYCLVYNYTKCIKVGPGHPEQENNPKCKKCLKSKPLRAHHCSICDRCVLKMDHHCPWINNCLGLRNHCYFLLFLFYLELGCLFYTAMALPVVLFDSHNIWTMTSFVLCAVFSLVIFFFCGWHWHLAIKGSTTIEYFDPKQNFSCGNWRKNLEVVFGTNSLKKIFIPFHKTLTLDGTYWPDTLQGV